MKRGQRDRGYGGLESTTSEGAAGRKRRYCSRGIPVRLVGTIAQEKSLERIEREWMFTHVFVS